MDEVQAAEVFEASKITSIDPNVFISSKGLKIRLKKVNRMVVVEAGRKIPTPPVPRFFNEDKNREEDNPSHPDYQDALRQANYDRGMMAVSVYLSLGTEVVTIPDGVEREGDTDWSDELDVLGISVPAKGKARYIAWLKYYALDDEEIDKLVTQCMKASGLVMEEDVKQVQESFRDS